MEIELGLGSIYIPILNYNIYTHPLKIIGPFNSYTDMDVYRMNENIVLFRLLNLAYF